jgi:hypothetical protein
MPWTDDFGQGTVKLIGLLELLAAVGLKIRPEAYPCELHADPGLLAVLQQILQHK